MKQIKTAFRLLALTKSLIGAIIIAVTLGVLGFICAQFITILGGYGIISFMGFSTIPLNAIFTLLIVFAILRGILHYGEQYANHYLAFKLLAKMRNIVFGKLRQLCPAKLECREKGNLISIITSDIELIEVFYAHTISPVLIAIIMSAIMVCFIGQFHAAMAIVALIGFVIVGIVIPLVVAKTSGKLAANYRKENGKLNSFILESLYGLSEIIQFNNAKNRFEKMHSISESLLEKDKKMKKSAGINACITTVSVTVFPIIMLIVSSILFVNGAIEIDGVIIGTLAMFSSFAPVIALANLGSGLQQTMAAAERVLDLLDEKAVVEEETKGENISFTNANCNNVSFAYNNENVLENVDIQIEPNTIIGIKGKSGSGKSTLLKLLMRFWDTGSGNITISETDIKNINTASLRSAQSMLSQETILFHDTIENNIKIANLNASYDEVVAACKKASVHDFIASLPHGYKTQVGELGDTLSGGERQRIGLARAFLHNAPFILLDEPTSNLDTLNEAVILKALNEERDNKTILIVSHRNSTMSIADKIHNMASGRMRGC